MQVNFVGELVQAVVQGENNDLCFWEQWKRLYFNFDLINGNESIIKLMDIKWIFKKNLVQYHFEITSSNTFLGIAMQDL